MVKHSEEFFELVLKSIPDMVFVKDRDFRIIQANDAFLSLYPENMRKNVIGSTTLEKYDKDEAEEFLKHDKKALREGLSETEETIMFPDGVRRTLFTKKVRFKDKSGGEYILAVARDITALKDTQKKLIEAEHTKKAYADATNDGYWDWFIQDDYEYMSPRFWEMLGYDPEEKKHHPSEWQDIIFPEDLEIALANFDKHVKTKGDYPFSQEVRYRHKTGSTVHVICKGQVVDWNDDNEPIRMIGTHTDITQLKKIEERLVEANSELEEFAYRTSHDLRSPLVSSIGLLNLANDALHNEDYTKGAEAIKLTKSSLEKLERLIDDILQLTRTGKEEEKEEIVDIEKIIDESLEKLSHLEYFDRLSIIKNIDLNHEVKTKISRMRLVVENLLSNAIKYQNRDEKNPYIKISCYEKNNTVFLEVADNGLGIPKAHHSDIFRMFKRFHTNVSFGSGLGLYMIKKSSVILGADLRFEPQKRGVKFILALPR